MLNVRYMFLVKACENDALNKKGWPTKAVSKEKINFSYNSFLGASDYANTNANANLGKYFIIFMLKLYMNADTFDILSDFDDKNVFGQNIVFGLLGIPCKFCTFNFIN